MELPLDQMTTGEKLQMMEAIWDNLSDQEADIQSPDWHGKVLADRQSHIAAGEARFSNLKQAKLRIRDQASS